MAGARRAPVIRVTTNLGMIRRLGRRTRAILLWMAFVGCGPRDLARAQRTVADSVRDDSIARAHQDSINRTLPGYVVDSILPIEEETQRFRAAIGGDSVTTLQHASSSRDALIQRFMKALASRDSAALRAMQLSPREFVDLVYPSSPYTHPPYRQSPGLTWMQIRNPSETGFVRLLRRLGGQPLHAVAYQCNPKPDRQGRNLLWTACAIRLAASDASFGTHRLFGSIIERDGRFKFVSYKNEL